MTLNNNKMKNQMKNQILSLLILLSLTGCFTQKKAQKQFNKAHFKYPEISAKGCSIFYPIKEKITIDTKYIQGEIDTFIEFVEVDCDTVIETKFKERIIQIPCPPRLQRVDTIYKTEYKELENTAKLEVLNINIKRLEADRIILESQILHVKKSSLFWKRLALFLTIIAVVYIIYKIEFYLIKWKTI